MGTKATEKHPATSGKAAAPDRRLRVYLAGPEVFRIDCEAVFENFRHECELAGFEALSPFDADLCDHSHGDASLAKRIYQANARLIHQCDAVVANLNSFRGSEPDSGTVWEMGFAVALGKPVVVCLDSLQTYRSRVEAQVGEHLDGAGDPLDTQHDMRVEDMGLPLNLMLACSASAIVQGGLSEALTALRAIDHQKVAAAAKDTHWKDPTSPRALSVASSSTSLEPLGVPNASSIPVAAPASRKKMVATS